MVAVDQVAQRLVGRRFFYGWIIVFIAFLDSIIIAGMGGYGLAFFLRPMSEDLDISRTAFSAITLFRLAAVPFVPLFGIAVDKKHGARLLLVFGSIAAGLALMATSRVQTLWHFYLIYGVLFGVAVMAFGGQVVGPAILAKWFIKRRGRVMALSAIGISAGGAVIAPLSGWLVSEFGWRTAWVVLGVCLILALAPLSALFMRRAPEDIGLLPDGAPSRQAAGAGGGIAPGASADTEYPWTVKEAIRTRALWLLVGVQTLGGIALSPVLLHQIAYIQDKGFDVATATAVATTLAWFAILGKLFFGFLVERFPIRRVLPLCMVPSGLSLILLIQGDSPSMLYAYAALHGVTMGGWAPLMNVAWANYFGRQHLGAIRGWVAPIGNIVGATSPFFAGVMWDLQGSYDFPFAVFAVAWVLGGLLVLVSTPPKAPVKTLPEPQPAPLP